jgi:uncharacterized protein YjbJ (UPF0337 family)
MTSQRTQGAVNTVRGKLEQAAGWLTGNRRQELGGKVREAQGSAQHGLGDIQDAVNKDTAAKRQDVRP